MFSFPSGIEFDFETESNVIDYTAIKIESKVFQ